MAEVFDVAVIGSGPGGYVAAIRAAQLGLKTACIEKEKALGGTCLNVGCIPSKALLHSSELYWNMQHHTKEHGIEIGKASVNFAQMMQRKASIVTSFNQGIAALFKKNRVHHYIGHAEIKSATAIAIASEVIEAKQIILATGSEPIPLPFLPFDEKRVLSSTGALALAEIPKRLLVVGAGVIGVELGSVYARLGSQVTFFEFAERICPTLDASLSQELQKALETQGMRFHLSSKVTAATSSEREVMLDVATPSGSQRFTGENALVSIGRRPYTAALGLGNVGIQPNAKGYIPVDGQFRTQVKNIFAIGDLIDGPMLAHKASEEGVAVAEIIAGQKPMVDYAALPNVVYTHPEIGSVGLTEKEAKEAGLQIQAGTFAFKANSRAKCTGETEGFVKILAEKTSKKIVGIHIIGAHASELIAEGALLIQKRCTIEDILKTPHAHPTLAEAIKEAALDVEKRALHK